MSLCCGESSKAMFSTADEYVAVSKKRKHGNCTNTMSLTCSYAAENSKIATVEFSRDVGLDLHKSTVRSFKRAHCKQLQDPVSRIDRKQ